MYPILTFLTGALLFALAVAENARAAMQLSATSMPSRRSPDVFKPGHLHRCSILRIQR
jgi:hypothetical protein